MPTTNATMYEPAPGDVARIEQVVADLQSAQRAESVEGFTGLFREDAVWVTALGKHLAGLDEISEFTAQVLPGAMAHSMARYEVVRITFVRPDVAVVNVHQTPLTVAGDLLEGEEHGSPVYVMAREGDRWLLVAGQNTRIAGSA